MRSHIFGSFQQVTFKLCIFTNFKAFFLAVLTDCRYLSQSKVEKTLEGSIALVYCSIRSLQPYFHRTEFPSSSVCELIRLWMSNSLQIEFCNIFFNLLSPQVVFCEVLQNVNMSRWKINLILNPVENSDLRFKLSLAAI